MWEREGERTRDCVLLCVCKYRLLQRPDTLDPLEVESQLIVRNLLGTEFELSGRAVHALNCEDISPPPYNFHLYTPKGKKIQLSSHDTKMSEPWVVKELIILKISATINGFCEMP